MPRHKHTAVARNRVKRQLRDLGRTALLPALRAVPALDVVLRAAPEAYGADRAMLAADVQRIVERLTGARA